jgi:hypothetical protein
MDAPYLCHCSSTDDCRHQDAESSSDVENIEILAIRMSNIHLSSVSVDTTSVPVQSVTELDSTITMAKSTSASLRKKSATKSVSKRSAQGYVTITWTYELRLGLQLMHEAGLSGARIAKIFKVIFKDHLRACGLKDDADIAPRLHAQYKDRRAKDWAMIDQPAQDSAEVHRRARLVRRIQDGIKNLGLLENTNSSRRNVKSTRDPITEWEFVEPPSTPKAKPELVATRTPTTPKSAAERIPYVKGNGSVSMMSPAQVAKTTLPIARVPVPKAHPETVQFTGLLFRFWDMEQPRTINSETGFWSRRHYNTLTLSEEAPLARCIDAVDIKHVRCCFCRIDTPYFALHEADTTLIASES